MSRIINLIIVLILISCVPHNPEKVVDAIQQTSCTSISRIEISDGFIDGEEAKITDQSVICEIYDSLKEKMNLPDDKYLPVNQNIESVDLLIYNTVNKLIFKVYVGKFNSSEGYIMVLDHEINSWSNKKKVRDIELPERLISLLK